MWKPTIMAIVFAVLIAGITVTVTISSDPHKRRDVHIRTCVIDNKRIACRVAHTPR